MANHLSQLIIKLVDNVSGPAKQAAQALKGVEKTVDAIGKSKGADNLAKSIKAVDAATKGINVNWSKTFADDIQRLGLKSKDVDKLKRSFDELVNSIGKKNILNAMPRIDEWEKSTIASLKRVASEAQRHMGRDAETGRFVGGGTGIAGLIAGSYAARRVGGAAVKSGAIGAREDARDYLAGLNASDTLALRGGAAMMSSRFMSIDKNIAHERLRDTAMSLGSVQKAIELGDVIGSGHTVLQSLKGAQAAVDESRKFFRALDTLGKNVDNGEIKSLYDGYIKALGVEGADIDLGDVFKLAKMSKSGGASLSNRFLMSIAPSLMQDMGPDRVGTAIGSMVSQVIGGRATKESKVEQERYGLREGDRFQHGNMMLFDPQEYTEKVLIPALKKNGVNIDDNAAATAAMSKLFSNQVVADLFNKLITQREQYERKSGQYSRAPGLAAAGSLAGRDPFVVLESIMAQMRNIGGAVFGKLSGPASAGMEKIASIANSIATAAEGAGGAVGVLTAGLGGLTAAVAAAAAGLKSVLPGVFGGGASAGAAAAGVLGGVAAGGAAASVATNEIVKSNKELRDAYLSNPMLGADPNGLALGAAIHDAPAIAKAMADALAEQTRKMRDGTPNDFSMSKDFNWPSDGPAKSAGENAGSGFRESLKSELQAAEQDVAASVGRMLNLLNFKAAPTVSPQINAPAGGATPGKQSSLNNVSRQLAARVDDKMRGNFSDTDYS